MALFNSPKELPVDQVKAMRTKGFDNNQIVQALQRNGYNSTQIFDALNQADLNSGAPPQADAPPGAPPPIINQQQPSAQGTGASQENMPPQISEEMTGVNPDEIEELVESIIEEKWKDLTKNINDISEWKREVQTQLTKIEQKFEGLKDDYDKLHQAIIGKIGEYDKNILNVGAEVKAMERVFSKVLPVFTENVNELSKIKDDLKRH